MPSIYQLKPRFQNLLRPGVQRLYARGVTANQVTTLACLLSIGYGATLALLLWQQQDTARWLWLGMPLFLFIRMALNAIDGQLARDHGQKSRLGGLLNEMGDVLADAALFAPLALMPGLEAWLIALFIWLALLTEYAGVLGLLLYLAVDAVGALFEIEEEGDAAVKTIQRSGFASFLYLEVLDASFSFDGVIGAFAITKDVVIIMLGLAIGAMFVRSMTVYLVNRGTLNEYIYLEHGAHYAIGALAAIMLLGTRVHVPEVITGLIGVGFIGASVWSSLRHRKKYPEHYVTT